MLDFNYLKMNHKDLEVWKQSMDLVALIYKTTDLFPKSEQFGLSQQMRRAAVSIPSNIAEGAARKGNKEFIQFVSIALGSLAELETQLLISERLNYIEGNMESNQAIISTRKLLIGFRNHLKKNQK